MGISLLGEGVFACADAIVGLERQETGEGEARALQLEAPDTLRCDARWHQIKGYIAGLVSKKLEKDKKLTSGMSPSGAPVARSVHVLSAALPRLLLPCCPHPCSAPLALCPSARRRSPCPSDSRPGAEFGRHWGEISVGQYDWRRREKEVGQGATRATLAECHPCRNMARAPGSLGPLADAA